MSAALSWFRAAKKESTAQIDQLCKQAAKLIQDRSNQTMSAAAEVTSPVRRVLDVLLLLLAGYVDPLTHAFQQAKGRSVTAAETLTPDRTTLLAMKRSIPVRLLVVIAVTLGLGYLAHRAAAAYKKQRLFPQQPSVLAPGRKRYGSALY